MGKLFLVGCVPVGNPSSDGQGLAALTEVGKQASRYHGKAIEAVIYARDDSPRFCARAFMNGQGTSSERNLLQPDTADCLRRALLAAFGKPALPEPSLGPERFYAQKIEEIVRDLFRWPDYTALVLVSSAHLPEILDFLQSRCAPSEGSPTAPLAAGCTVLDCRKTNGGKEIALLGQIPLQLDNGQEPTAKTPRLAAAVPAP